MKKTKHLIGIITSILIIVSLSTSILLSSINESSLLTEYILNFCTYSSYTLIFVLLRNLIVKDFKHRELNIVMILIAYSYGIFSALNIVSIFIPVNTLLIILMIGDSVLVFLFYIMFINKIFRIDKAELPYIEFLKNFGLIYLVIVLGQIIISMVIEFSQSHPVGFLEYMLPVFPVFFLLMFFIKMYSQKDEVDYFNSL
ncbi:hypothetical protein ACE01N_09040 [Saccharicrinis sp. FJH2]|uniref:hypothetical protein n=1 Tax=Saccharicrinis sp. FJH65 TaxID=3344659 RepID=UPI0035F233BF